MTLKQVAILVDDMIDTGHTLALAAPLLKEKGATKVYALISHGEHRVVLIVFLLLVLICCSPRTIIGLLSDVKMSVIQDLPIESLVVSIQAACVWQMH